MKIIPPLKRVHARLNYMGALIIFIIAFQYHHVCGQPREIDSLNKLLLAHPKPDTARVVILNKLSYEYYSTSLSYLRVYGNQALQLATQLNYPVGEATAYKNLGLGYIAANADPKALDYFDKSLRIFETLHDRGNSARVLNNIGYYYGVVKDYKQELYYLLQAYAVIKASPNMMAECIILGNIGNAYEAMQQFVKAHQYYDKELFIANVKKLPYGIVTSYCNLASVNLKEKNYSQALNYGDKVLALKQSSDNFKPRDVANIDILEGKIYYSLKNYDKARQFFSQSLPIASSLGNAEFLTQNYYSLYLLDSVKQDYRSALKNYSQFNKLDDSLTNVNKNQLIALYQIRFDSQKRATENERLRIEEEKNQAIITQQHKTQVILLIGLFVILGGAGYLFHINNQVKAKSKIINEQNQVLENNNIVKDKLFSVISHDLRSPITQVVGLLNLWEAGEMSAEEMAVMIPSAKGSIMHTLELIDNLLIWSKNQLQGFNFDPLAFDMRELVQENIKSLQSLTQKKTIRIENNILPDTIVYADKEMIKIVLRNLISNAIKFTPDEGLIRVSNTVKQGYIIVCVEDSGIGIKEADQNKIFSFTSHTTLGTANEKGTGIGLKICRDFIELNKGSIWMESEENVGSKFYVSIPVNAANA